MSEEKTPYVKLYPEEPHIWSEDTFNELLHWGTQKGMSDLLLNPGQNIFIRIHGKYLCCTKRPVRQPELAQLVNHVSGLKNASSTLNSGEALDFGYALEVGRGQVLRFRGNATSCEMRGRNGFSITLRSIPGTPPRIQDYDVEPEIMEALFPDRGLVIVTGTMGSGKSTLISSAIRYIREEQPYRYVVTYEEPVEFDLVNIPKAAGPIAQTNVLVHLKEFCMCARNSARRAADVTLMGESRDPETFRTTLELSELGVASYTTAHTRSVGETMRRIIMQFDKEEQPTVLSLLGTSLQLIISQRLVSKVGGGRIAVREWLVFTPELRAELSAMEMEPGKWVPFIQERLNQTGNSMTQYAKRLLDRGLITKEVFENIRKDVGMGYNGVA